MEILNLLFVVCALATFAQARVPVEDPEPVCPNTDDYIKLSAKEGLDSNFPTNEYTEAVAGDDVMRAVVDAGEGAADCSVDDRAKREAGDETELAVEKRQSWVEVCPEIDWWVWAVKNWHPGFTTNWEFCWIFPAFRPKWVKCQFDTCQKVFNSDTRCLVGDWKQHWVPAFCYHNNWGWHFHWISVWSPQCCDCWIC